MNKILSAVIGGFLGVTMATAIGVGMVVGSKAEYKETTAASVDTYTFTSKSWEATLNNSASNWTSGQDGTGFSNNGIQVTTNSTGANGTSKITYNGISKIVLTYNTNKNKGAGTFGIQIGSNAEQTVNWAHSGNKDGTSANFTATKTYTSAQSGKVKITINTTKNSCYLVSCAVTYTSTVIDTTYTYTDTITRQTTGLPLGTSNYQDWSGKILTSAAVYAGQSSAGNNAIQIRDTYKNSGVITTASGGKVKSIELNFSTATTPGRKVSVYGSSSAYSSPADIYDSDKRGTNIGSATYVEGTAKYTITPTDDYAYFGLRSMERALWLDSIVVTWETTTEVEKPTSLTVTSQPETTTFGVGEKLNLKGLAVKDNNDEEYINYKTEPAEATVFETGDIGNNKAVTITSLADSTVKTTFTINVVAAFPVSLTKTAPIAYSQEMTLAEGTARFKATLTDGNEITNIKIGDSGTTLTINDETIDTSSLAVDYAGQWAKLSYTFNDRTATSTSFRIVVEDHLLVDHFDDVPDYVLSGESATINAHYTSFIGKPEVSVRALESDYLSVSFNSTSVTYDSGSSAGIIPITVTAGNVSGQYSVEVTISLNGETASNTCSIIVRTAEPGHEGSGDFELISKLADITTGNYVIAANVDGTYYGMTSTVNNNKFASEELTVNSDNQITSDTYTVYRIEATGDGDYYIKLNEKYVTYTSSTNINFADDPYAWTINTGNYGTFEIDSGTEGRAILFRTVDENVNPPKEYYQFGGYATSNISPTKSARQYYNIELFKYNGSEEEDTGATEFELVKGFVDTYMHMEDIAITTLDNNNACMGSNGYYALAKAGWNSMLASYTGSYTHAQIKTLFQDQFPDAYQRYVTWAAKNGDADPFDGNAFVPSNSQPTRVIDVNNNAMPAIIITISFVTVSTIAGYYLLKKKKQK